MVENTVFGGPRVGSRCMLTIFFLAAGAVTGVVSFNRPDFRWFSGGTEVPIGLSENTSLAQMVLTLSLENFYLQITDETLNESWLKTYFSNIRQMVAHFSHPQNKIAIDGSV
jgi:hypothetical protein